MIIIPYEAILQIQSERPTRDPNAPPLTADEEAERMAAAAIKEAKDLHAKCEAIWNTRRALLGGRFVSVKMEVEGRMRTLMSAYAPAKPIAGIPM